MARQRPLPIDPLAEAKRQWVAHGWTDAATGMSVVTSVIRAQQILMARIDAALKPFGLSFARYEMLRLLAFTRDGRMPMASAIARLQVHPTSVTNPVDGRAAMLVLTDAGRDVVERATVALNAEVFENVGLDDGDAEELAGIIARMRKDAGDFTDPRPVPDPL